MEINNLKGSFLSNFYESSIELDAVVYRNAEAAYQAMKSNDSLVRVKFINLNGASAKALGKRIELRKDWNDIKLDKKDFYLIYISASDYFGHLLGPKNEKFSRILNKID